MTGWGSGFCGDTLDAPGGARFSGGTARGGRGLRFRGRGGGRGLGRGRGWGPGWGWRPDTADARESLVDRARRLETELAGIRARLAGADPEQE